MTQLEFDVVVKGLREKLDRIDKTKGIEYSQGQKDRLSNFNRLAEGLGMRPEQVCWVYLVKHLDAIQYAVKTGGVLSESLEDRIVDAIKYLELLYALHQQSPQSRSRE